MSQFAFVRRLWPEVFEAAEPHRERCPMSSYDKEL